MERKLNGIEEVGVVGGSDGKGFQTGRDEGADGGTRSVNGVRSEPEADRSGGVKSTPETELGSEVRNREHGGSADVKREKQKITEGLRGRQQKPLTESFEKFEKKLWLSSPTMHGPELKYMTEAYESNWMSTVGENIDEVERLTCEKVSCRYAVALSS